MLRSLRRLALGAILTGALLAVGYPAAAAPATDRQAAVAAATTGVSYKQMGSGTNNAYCFTYYGTLKPGSYLMYVDWTNNGSVDECFGVTSGRTIWHAWPGSGGWKQMPNNGRADDTDLAFVSNGHHVVSVYVAGSGHPPYYCSTLTTSWQPWVPC